MKKRLLAGASIALLLVGVLVAPAQAAINNISVGLDKPTPATAATAFTWTWSGYQTAASVKCVRIEMDTAADGSGSLPAGMSLAATTLTGTYGGTWTLDATSIASGVVVFNWATGVTPAAGPKTLVLGNVTTPTSAGTYYELLTTYDTNGSGSSGACGGSTRDAQSVAAWETTTAQTASVTIDPSLGLTVNTVGSAQSCGDATTTLATSANTVNLGHITSTAVHPIGGQSLNVTTNATNGYTVYLSSATANMNGGLGGTFTNVTGTNASPVTWPANGTEAFGYHAGQGTLSGASARFHSNKWASISTTGSEVMYNATTPAAIGDTQCIAFQASEAGNSIADTYTVTVRYNAVPVF